MSDDEEVPATQQVDEESEDGYVPATQQWDEEDGLSEAEEEPASPAPPPPAPSLVLTRLTAGPEEEQDYFTPRVIKVPVNKSADSVFGRALQGTTPGVDQNFVDERRAADGQRMSSRHFVLRWRNSGVCIVMLPIADGGRG